MNTKAIFRWRVVSVSLIVLAILYWAVALLNFWLIHVLEQRGDTRNVRFLLMGSFWNFIVGALCLGGRRLLKSSNSGVLIAGALATGVALLIIQRNWLGGLMTGRSGFPVLEAVLIWPWLAYAVAYAVRQIQAGGIAEPSAPPNGGPATRSDNSVVGGGPPSVS
jgi:peptidoglycan/LPS O-acetylase OafA/YrhL